MDHKLSDMEERQNELYKTTIDEPNWNKIVPFKSDKEISDFFSGHIENANWLAKKLRSRAKGVMLLSDGICYPLSKKYRSEHSWSDHGNSDFPAISDIYKNFIIDVFSNDKEINEMDKVEKRKKLGKIFTKSREIR